MFIRVKLLNGFQKPLTYKVPDAWDSDLSKGTLIQVPLQKRFEYAYIEELIPVVEQTDYIIREAHAKDLVPHDTNYLSFISKLSSYHGIDQLQLLRRLTQFLKSKPEKETTVTPEDIQAKSPIILSNEQQEIVDALSSQITNSEAQANLVHGVTGSGKTEIYKRLIEHTSSLGKSTILLLPEITLALQFERLLKSQLPESIPCFGFHSGSSSTQKKELWRHLMLQKPCVIIGVHQPVLLPIAHLGLIIIDEEHEVGYQEKKHPKINSKEAALLRGQLYQVPVVCGSATPSISSLYNVKERGWHFFQLKKRYAGEFPRVETVKLTDKQTRAHFFISKQLEEAITEQLEKKEQTLIFLNRRGYSFFIQCKSCGDIPKCVQCSVHLTLHNPGRLVCHYCNFERPEPKSCAACNSIYFIKKGIGTQQVVSILEKLFPQARIARADLDATISRKTWTHTLEEFSSGDIDILVGTQTITKGYHFPKVTLVGILWADINLGIPFYNAAETTLQQLIQVAGRAGRQTRDSLVIVQTMINHPIFSYIKETDYPQFYQQEIANRALVHYPPCVRFAEIELKHSDEETVSKDALAITLALKKVERKLIVLGPSQPLVHQIKNIFSRKIYIKASSVADILFAYNTIKQKIIKSAVYLTQNPLS